MSSSEASAAPDPITRILGYLVAIAAILGIPGGLYGFFSAEHAKRVEKTFEFYSEFRGEAFQKNWSYLIGKWNAQADEVKKLTDANDQEGIRKLASAIAMDEAGRKSFEEVLGFFDGLAACVETSLCDGNSAAALLRLPASDFASAFGPHIIFVRKMFGNTEYGTGLFQTRALERRWSLF